MKSIITVAMAVAICAGVSANVLAEDKPASALAFKVKTLEGKEVDLAKYQGKVVLVVNVASECGLTPQYEQLQGLHDKYAKQGLVILGFPCNQFGRQEPGSATEIRKFCTDKYNVTFDLFEKIDVNGDGAAPFYKHLKALPTQPKGPGEIGWNFEKFLIGRSGQVLARYAPRTRPDAPEVIEAIESELAKK